MDNSSIIEVKNLTKTFGKFTAVDDISFDVKKDPTEQAKAPPYACSPPSQDPQRAKLP